MTTNDIIRKLGYEISAHCKVCEMIRPLSYEDLEIGLVCESCVEHIRQVDIMLNYELIIGWSRPVHPYI